MQIERVAFHPRKKDGTLAPPAPAVAGRTRGRTLESELAFLRGLSGWDPSKPRCRAAERALYERYGRLDEWPPSPTS